MKRIIAAVFCILLAGSALVQSCKKPDEATIAPIIPMVPLTEAEMLQKALGKLLTDTFLTVGGFTRVFINKYATDGSGYTFHQERTEGPPLISAFMGTDHLGKYSWLANGRTSVMGTNDVFYNKIFVNTKGDKFIGLTCNGPKNEFKVGGECLGNHNNSNHNDSTIIAANDFKNMEIYRTLYVPPVADSKLYDHPEVEIQYYFEKDSMSIFTFSGTDDYPKAIVTHTSNLRVSYIKKKESK